MIPPSPPPVIKRKFPVWDVVAIIAVILVIGIAIANTLANMRLAGANVGFGFLGQAAGFDVSEALIPYGPDQTYGRVIIVGLLNTLFLAVVSLVLATLVGLIVGLVSVGPSPFGRMVALGYVELFRNLPKLLVLLVLFVAAVSGLPHVRTAFDVGHFHLSNRAIYFPILIWHGRLWFVVAALILGIVLTRFIARKFEDQRARTGDAPPVWPVGIALIFGLPFLVVHLFAVPIEWSLPVLQGFDFQGGGRLSIQFVVMATTLALYHGAQIGEVVRGGIQSVAHGQTEAAQALGLSRPKTMRLVILPQVVRIVIPSMNNQYVNLIKNTSIAIAVGYSDLMSVAGTIVNQSFRPFEMMMITMAIYLTICLAVTGALNHLNEKIRLVGKG